MPLQYLKNPETQQMGFYDTDTKRWISDINPMVSNFIQNQNIPQVNRMPSSPWDQMIQMNQGNPQLQFQPVIGTEQDFDILKGTTNSPFNTQTGQSTSTTAPTSLEDLDRMVKSGELTDMNLINQYELQLGNNPTAPSTTGIEQNTSADPTNPTASTQENNPYNQAPWWSAALNFSGSDLSTEAYSLGMRLGQEQGTPGRGLGIVGSAGAFALGATRDLLSGLSTQKMNNYISDWYKKSKQRVNYTPDSQTQDNNYLGGQPLEKGGEIGKDNKSNPYYAQQLELYNQSKTQSFDFPVDKVLEGEELDNWLREVGMQPSLSHQSTNLFVGGYRPIKVLYNTASNNFHPIYEEPKKEIESTGTTPNTPPAVTSASTPSTRYFKSNISYSSNPNASAGINIPYISEEERLQIINDFKNIKTEQDYKNSPYYQRYGQNVYKQGISYVPSPVTSMQQGGSVDENGNVIGYRMPLDGSQLPENKQSGFAIFPNQYGDINFFAEAYNKLKAQMEQSAASEPYFVDAEGNLIPRGVNPSTLSSPYVSMQESRRQARDLNRRIRQDELPYQKIQRDAFYNPDGSKEVPSFGNGGEYTKGQYIEFMYGGEKISGKFDRIENGKIYLQ